MRYYPYNIGDYAAATAHLSWEEDLAYRRMIDWYYANEKPLPGNEREIFRLTRASTDTQRDAVRVVLVEFFVKSEDGYHQSRCDSEIAAMHKKSAKASDSASVRWSRGNGAVRSPENDAHTERIKNRCERIEEPCERIENRCYPIPNTQDISHLTTSSSVTVAARASGAAENVAAQQKKQPPEKTQPPTASPPPAPFDEFEEIDHALRAIPGIGQHPVATSPVIGPILEIVRKGHSFRMSVEPTIRRVLAKAKPGSIRSWQFFVPAILDDIGRADAAGQAAASVDWPTRLKTARALKCWDTTWGPQPGEPQCQAPADLLQPGDGGWPLWKRVAA